MSTNTNQTDEELFQDMQHVFYRHDCPSVAQLIDYHAGFASAAVVRQIEVHTGECPHCRTELATFDPMPVTESKQIESLRPSLRQIWITFAKAFVPSLLSDADKGELFTNHWVDAKEVNWSLILSQSLKSDSLYQLEGRILGPDESELRSIEPVLYSLSDNKSHIGQIDPKSRAFNIDDVPQGSYRLHLLTDTFELKLRDPIHF